MKMILAMMPTIILVVYGQLVTKWRVGIISDSMQGAQDHIVRLIMYLKDPFIISSYIAALAGSAGWMFVVEKYAISIAFPTYVGLTVIVVSICGILFFNESLNMSKVLAIALIISGVVVGSRS